MPLMVMGTFWECPFPPVVHLQDSPQFSHLTSEDRTKRPRCVLWHGWLRGLCPRAVGKVTLGSYPFTDDSPWRPGWEQEDIEDIADSSPVHLFTTKYGRMVVRESRYTLMSKLREQGYSLMPRRVSLITRNGEMLRI